MAWSVEIITPPATTPVSLADAKAHMRVDHDSEDSLIARLIETATQDCEDYAGRAFVTRTLRLHIDRFPSTIYLPYPPVTSVSRVAWYGWDGTERVLDPADYVLDLTSAPARIVPALGKSWPTDTRILAGVAVTYEAGYGTTPAAVPAVYRSAVLLLAAHLYENREATVVSGAVPMELPLGVRHLLAKQRVFVPEVA